VAFPWQAGVSVANRESILSDLHDVQDGLRGMRASTPQGAFSGETAIHNPRRISTRSGRSVRCNDATVKLIGGIYDDPQGGESA
jgi:hypothetical protein